jgi:uncharacterized protein YecE (DUF72 family)
LWGRVTHQKRLADFRQELQDVMAAVAGFDAKRGPLLIQLPPSLRRDEAKLDGFLADLRRTIDLLSPTRYTGPGE